ncbi:MAG TPA: hypothetical protein VL968_00425 [Rhodocyclaceae bacterium]|jgi:hypothetical protein|nr:hypothetical protein [Rhodocyclaceae bacterium]
MKISASSIAMGAYHQQAAQESTTENLEVWNTPTAASNATSNSPTTLTSLSATGLTLANQASAQITAASDAVENDPYLQLVRIMVEWLTGKPVKVFSAANLGSQANGSTANDATVAPSTSSAQASSASTTAPSAGYGLRYDFHQVRTESETTQVAMAGSVRTSDGQTVDFQLSLAMSRSFSQETSVSLQAGDAKRRDPLVINFGGSTAQLLDQHFRFDLNGDGSKENIAQLGAGSGYLAFDKNGNGIIDNGQELFGPATNSGFGELAQLDSDGNGWIDENDPAFKQLSVWMPDAQGGKLMSLAQLQIGALYTGHTSSPFELRGSNNANLGAVTATGLYLNENGSVGSLQEVDLTV